MAAWFEGAGRFCFGPDIYSAFHSASRFPTGDSICDSSPLRYRVVLFPACSVSFRSPYRWAGWSEAGRSKAISGAAMANDRAVSRRTDAGGDGSAREAGSFLLWQRGRGRVENGRRGEDVEADFRFATGWIDRGDCRGAFGFERDLRGLGRSGHA